MPLETMSRPAELVQRAKQLAQLTNFQFGRGTVPVPQQPSPQNTSPASGSNGSGVSGSSTTAIVALGPSTGIGNGNGNGNGYGSGGHGSGHGSVGGHQPRIEIPEAAPVKTTAQKIEEFYGVKQVGEEVVFAVKFESARRVQIAGDFNNWCPMSTPMQSDAAGRVADEPAAASRAISLSLRRGRQVDDRSEQPVCGSQSVWGA